MKIDDDETKKENGAAQRSPAKRETESNKTKEKRDQSGRVLLTRGRKMRNENKRERTPKETRLGQTEETTTTTTTTKSSRRKCPMLYKQSGRSQPGKSSISEAVGVKRRKEKKRTEREAEWKGEDATSDKGPIKRNSTLKTRAQQKSGRLGNERCRARMAAPLTNREEWMQTYEKRERGNGGAHNATDPLSQMRKKRSPRNYADAIGNNVRVGEIRPAPTSLEFCTPRPRNRSSLAQTAAKSANTEPCYKK